MARKQHWLMEIANDCKARMRSAAIAAGSGLKDTVPFGEPAGVAPPPPDLEAFMQASPEERQAFLMSIPPDDYAKVTGDLMTEANNRYGSMSQVLNPMFAMEEANASGQRLAAMQESGVNDIGAAAGMHELTELLGFDPFE